MLQNLRPLLAIVLIVQLLGLPAPPPPDTCCGREDIGRCAADCPDPCANCACCADRSPVVPGPVIALPLVQPSAEIRILAAAPPCSPAPREILHVPEVAAA